jgi:hypothetical protein
MDQPRSWSTPRAGAWPIQLRKPSAVCRSGELRPPSAPLLEQLLSPAILPGGQYSCRKPHAGGIGGTRLPKPIDRRRSADTALAFVRRFTWALLER